MEKIGKTDFSKTKITLEEFAAFYNIGDYLKLVKAVKEKIDADEIIPVKASGSNGKKPALFNCYRIVKKGKMKAEWKEELDFKIHPSLSVDYYKKNPDCYERDRKNIVLLSDYLYRTNQNKGQPCSLNERSFEIFHREKFLDAQGGRTLLKNLSFALEELNIYETREPLAYYKSHKQIPQNILIIENKDTFYSIRRHLLEGSKEVLSVPVGTVIYGRGKGIIKAYEDFDLCAEPYMLSRENTLLYFGDLDYEGIKIYEGFSERFGNKYAIKPFEEGYVCMLKKAAGCELPDTKEGQEAYGIQEFLKAFKPKEQREIKHILETRKYIPQEILNISDF